MSGCAFDQLGGKLRGACEIKAHRYRWVLPFILAYDFAYRIRQRRSRKKDDFVIVGLPIAATGCGQEQQEKEPKPFLFVDKWPPDKMG